MSALFRREFRDLVRFVPIGLVLVAILCWYALPSSVHQGAQTEARFLRLVGLGCGLVALGFGWLQSAPEVRPDVRGYLLHRPLSIAKMFGAKLLAGFAAYMLCCVPPLLGSVLYLESVGLQRYPASGWQVLPIGVYSLVVFVVHPAAMWTMYREARWVGTRSFPLVLAAGSVFFCWLLLSESRSLVSFAAFVVVALLVWGLVAHAAWHAFAHQTFSPPASSPEAMATSRLIGLFLASLLVVTVPVALVIESVLTSRASVGPSVRYRMALGDDGRLWEIAERQSVGMYGQVSDEVVLGGRPLSNGEDVAQSTISPLPESWEEIPLISLFAEPSGHWRLIEQFGYIGAVSPTDVSESLGLFEHRGRIYAYSTNVGLVGCVTPHGIYTPEQVPEGRFAEATLLSVDWPGSPYRVQPSINPLISDVSGIYQLQFGEQRIRKLIDGPVESVGMQLSSDSEEGVIWVQGDGELRRYAVRALNADDPMRVVDDQSIRTIQNYPLPPVEATLMKRLVIAPHDWQQWHNVADSAGGETVLTRRKALNQLHYQIYEADGTMKVQDTARLNLATPGASADLLVAIVPPGLFWGATVGRSIATEGALISREVTSSLASWVWPVTLLHALIAAAVVGWLTGTRDLSWRRRLLWMLVAALSGIATALAVIAIYPRPVREQCSQCDGLRRVDRERCEHCGAAWEPPPKEGIEILGASWVTPPNLAASS